MRPVYPIDPAVQVINPKLSPFSGPAGQIARGSGVLDGMPDELEELEVLDELDAYDEVDVIDEVISLLVVLLGNDDKGPVELVGEEVEPSEEGDDGGVVLSVRVPDMLVSEGLGVEVLVSDQLVSEILRIEMLVAGELGGDSVDVADSRLLILVALSTLWRLPDALVVTSMPDVSEVPGLDQLEVSVDARLENPIELDRPSAGALEDSLDFMLLERI